MNEYQRLLALLDVYDEAIEELYVLGDRRFVDLILRLERRRRRTDQRLEELNVVRTTSAATLRSSPVVPALDPSQPGFIC
jgi:hypothetical protein